MQENREAKKKGHRGQKSPSRKAKRAMSAIYYAAAQAGAAMRTPKVDETSQTAPSQPTAPTTSSPTTADNRQPDQQPAKPVSPRRRRNRRSAKQPTTTIPMNVAQPQPRRPVYSAEEPMSAPPPKAPNTGGPSTGRSDRKAKMLRITMKGAAAPDLIDQAIQEDRRRQTERRMTNRWVSDDRRKNNGDRRGMEADQVREAMEA